MFFTLVCRQNFLKRSNNKIFRYLSALTLSLIALSSHSAAILIIAFMIISLLLTEPFTSSYIIKKLPQQPIFFSFFDYISRATLPSLSKIRFDTILIIMLGLLFVSFTSSSEILQQYLPGLRPSVNISNFSLPKLSLELFFIFLSYSLLCTSKMIYLFKNKAFFIASTLLTSSIVILGLSLDGSILIGRFSPLYGCYVVFEFLMCQRRKIEFGQYFSFTLKECKTSYMILKALIVVMLCKLFFSIYGTLTI